MFLCSHGDQVFSLLWDQSGFLFKSVLVKFYFLIIYLFHLKFQIHWHQLFLILSYQINLCEVYTYEILFQFEYCLVIPSPLINLVRNLAIWLLRNQLWTLLSYYLLCILPSHKFMFIFSSFLLPYLGLFCSHFCHF